MRNDITLLCVKSGFFRNEFLKKPDIDQVIEYLQQIDGDSAVIYVADFTEVPDSIEDYATLNAVDIEYTNWRLSSSE